METTHTTYSAPMPSPKINQISPGPNQIELILFMLKKHTSGGSEKELLAATC